MVLGFLFSNGGFFQAQLHKPVEFSVVHITVGYHDQLV